VLGAQKVEMLQIKFHSLMIQRERKAEKDDMCLQHAMVLCLTRGRRKMWKNMPRRFSSMKTFESNKYLIELCACFSCSPPLVAVSFLVSQEETIL
jgi:hypothetical protein